MTTEDKIQVALSFLENDVNYNASDTQKQNLYILVSCLHRILSIQLALEHDIQPLDPFGENEKQIYLGMAISYLAIPRQNEGDENSLMVRYVRNYFESFDEIIIQADDEELPQIRRTPRLERSMNIYSPFTPLFI